MTMTPEELRDWRRRLILSQAKAASELGISTKTYQELERGLTFGSNQPRAIDRRTALACWALEHYMDGAGRWNLRD